MRWSVTIPGQPVSWDAAYRTGLIPVRRKVAGQRVAVLNPDGSKKMIHRPMLTAEAEQWKLDVYRLCTVAKPSHWRPEGQIRIEVVLRLAHDMDDDNAMKLARDALASAIDHDDINFLMTTKSKSSGYLLRDACVILTIDDDPAP